MRQPFAEMKQNIDDNPLRFSWNTSKKGSEGLRTKIVAIVDPTTETAQRLSPLLITIRDELKLPLDLILAPRPELDGDSDIPISSYYRFVADSSAYQSVNGIYKRFFNPDLNSGSFYDIASQDSINPDKKKIRTHCNVEWRRFKKNF